MNKRVCFFPGVRDKRLLEMVNWYKNDIQILKDLGCDVKIATYLSEILPNFDLYFSWWATTSIYPLIKAQLSRKSIIVVIGGSEVVHLDKEPTAAAYPNKPWYVRKAIKYCVKHATMIACISESIKKEVDSLGAKKSRVVYLGIDTKLYKPNPSKPKDIVFTVSHFTENHIQRKRLFEIIEAAEIILSDFPELKFVIAGAKTTAKTKIKERIKDAGLERYFLLLEGISEAEKIEYYQRSLVYLQPTLHEAFGVSNAEAMSCGIPVVSSKVAAVPEVVGDCGLYADPFDARDIANKVLILLRNDELRKNLGHRARDRIKRHLSYNKRRETMREVIHSL